MLHASRFFAGRRLSAGWGGAIATQVGRTLRLSPLFRGRRRRGARVVVTQRLRGESQSATLSCGQSSTDEAPAVGPLLDTGAGLRTASAHL